jgi:hypothetical protein
MEVRYHYVLLVVQNLGQIIIKILEKVGRTRFWSKNRTRERSVLERGVLERGPAVKANSS